MKWDEFYKFPLMIDEYGGNVIAQPGKMGYRWAFDWIGNEWICEYPIGGQKGEMLAQHIVDVLNNKTDYIPIFHWTKDEEDPCVIRMNDQPCICIRGWGELTGTGALNLSHDEAAKIQDDFRDFIINKLNDGKNEKD